MALRPLLVCGDPRLHAVAQPITDFGDPELSILIQDLLETMGQANGVGIAAPQIGVGSQVIVVASRPNVRYPDAPQMQPLVMINPRLVAVSETQEEGEEGCLSVPDQRGRVSRSTQVEVAYEDAQGIGHTGVWTGFVARIIQHEYDHLQGILFIQRQPETAAPAHPSPARHP